jgi:hypothetical protein
VVGSRAVQSHETQHFSSVRDVRSSACSTGLGQRASCVGHRSLARAKQKLISDRREEEIMKQPLGSRHGDTPAPAPTANRFGGLVPLPHDPDERPSREDRDFGQTIFTRQASELPRFLRGGRRKSG